MAEKRVNLAHFVESGLLNDVDVTCESFRYVVYDYDGKADPATCLRVDMIRDGESEVHHQYFSVGGGADAFLPSKDETYLVAASDRESLSKGSNYYKFMASLEGLGLEKDRYAEGISALDGLRCHVMRIPDVSREGMPDSGRKRRDSQGQERKPEIMVVTKIHEFPWDAKGKGKNKAKNSDAGAGSASSASKTSKAATSGDDDEEVAKTATTLVTKALMSEGGAMGFDSLMVAVFQGAPKPLRKAVSQLVTLDWLEEQELFEVDKDTVSLAE